MGRDREVRTATGNSADDRSNTALRAELRTYPLETNKRREKVHMEI